MRTFAVVVSMIVACGRPTPPSPSPSASPVSIAAVEPDAATSVAPAAPAPTASSAVRAMLAPEAVDEVDWRVAGGFDSPERIVDLVSAHAGAARDAVKEEVDRKLAAHAAKATTWKGRTDVEKIEAVFAALERDGILARPNYGASQDEANAMIDEEVKKRRAAGKPVRGWVYFTDDNLKMAVREGTLLLLFGAPGPADASWDAIASTLEARLKAAGLKAEWPYRHGAYPVRIEGLEWRKRRQPP